MFISIIIHLLLLLLLLRVFIFHLVLADVDASTAISSIRRDGSPGRNLAPPSVEGSVDTASSLDSVTTNDDAVFRARLAQLDADIAIFQHRLQGSVASPTSAHPSPRSATDRRARTSS